MKPYVLGAIFARGGSKELPRKNIRKLEGKPLIAYAIEVGKEVSLIDRLIVSTDDEEISKVARDYGAEVPFMRPAELAGDDSPELLAWQHAIKTVEESSGRKIDILVSIPATSPLRKVQDVERCLQMFLDSDADIIVTVKRSERNPYFNMLMLDKEGYAQLVVNNRKDIFKRQQAPKVYDMTTVAYVARASYICSTSSILEGKVKAVVIPRERAIDIDTITDFEIAEFFMRKRSEN